MYVLNDVKQYSHIHIHNNIIDNKIRITSLTILTQSSDTESISSPLLFISKFPH